MRERYDNLLAVHFSRFLAQKSGCSGERQAAFQAIVERLVLSIAEGHSCLPLQSEEMKLMASSALVCTDGKAPLPLVLREQKLYLHRYFAYESRLARQLRSLVLKRAELPGSAGLIEAVFEPEDDQLQREAAERAVTTSLTIISGGPGTGKTTTVAKILQMLTRLSGGSLKIALAAPTGKAAVRLQQSLAGVSGDVGVVTSSTLHRLLGYRRDSPQFTHTAENPLPWDVVIVDEASMVDLAMMSKLVDALHPDARLILLGDKDQLASVESGSVLSDMIQSLPDTTVVLEKSYRFDTGIKAFAEAVNSGDGERAWQLVEGDGHANLQHLAREKSWKSIHDGYGPYLSLLAGCDSSNCINIFRSFHAFQVLCGTRAGKYGADSVNRYISAKFVKWRDGESKWWPGKPVMVTRNNYSLNLFNGDIGICLNDHADPSRLKVWFEDGRGGYRPVLPSRLPEHEVAFALTVHKSQGSEFGRVLVMLPEEESPLLTRELLYTAITRARESVAVCSEKDVFTRGVMKKTARHSGLAEMLAEL